MLFKSAKWAYLLGIDTPSYNMFLKSSTGGICGIQMEYLWFLHDKKQEQNQQYEARQWFEMLACKFCFKWLANITSSQINTLLILLSIMYLLWSSMIPLLSSNCQMFSFAFFFSLSPARREILAILQWLFVEILKCSL